MLLVCISSITFAAENDSKGPGEVYILDRPLIPTGYGLTKQLNKDYYLGRFSIDKSAVYRSLEDLLIIDAARQMEYKFVSDRKISGSTFARKLAEAMKINNDPEALRDNIVKIKRFKNFFKKPFKKGDVLRFDYHTSFGTRVFHNNRLIGEVPASHEFFRFVLNTWVGTRPPSSTFKTGVLGQNGDEYAIRLQQRYESM